MVIRILNKLKINQYVVKLRNIQGAKKVALNTVILYTQRFFTAALSLITTPIILKALGVENFGIYTLTVGFVATLAFVNWSLSSATQRFIAFAIGEGNFNKLKRIFVSAAVIHVAYGLLLLFLIALLGSYFVDHWLTIPPERVAVTKQILLIVASITFINIVSVPFISVLRAHESFFYLAILGIFESVFKLIIAISLLYINFDKLLSYSVLLLLASFIILFLRVGVSRKFYKEVNTNLKNIDFKIFKEIISFLGWSLLGAFAIIGRNQAVSIIINIFFGVVKNAAYGIAMQVNAAVGMLSQGIIGSISPKIIKSAGSGDLKKMVYLMRTMSKFSVISVSIVAIPFIFEAPYILKYWLSTIPEDAVLFSRLIVCFGLITGFSAGIEIVFGAIGKVKVYNIWISLILIMNIPISYYLFKIGFPSYTILLVSISLEIISFIVRLYLLHKYVEFSILEYLKDVFIQIIMPIFIVSLFMYSVKFYPLSNYIQVLFTILVFVTLYPTLTYFVSLDKIQKNFANHIFKKIYNKLVIIRSS